VIVNAYWLTSLGTTVRQLTENVLSGQDSTADAWLSLDDDIDFSPAARMQWLNMVVPQRSGASAQWCFSAVA